MNKRGQVYLIAAIIIVAILFSVAFYSNYVRSVNRGSKIYDIGGELQIETGSVYDYGTYDKKSSAEVDNLIESWLTVFSGEKEIVESWYFIYGDAESMTALYFTPEDSGSICLSVSGGGICTKFKKVVTGSGEITFNVDNEQLVTVEFGDVTYEFELGEGENFFFVITGEGDVAIN